MRLTSFSVPGSLSFGSAIWQQDPTLKGQKEKGHRENRLSSRAIFSVSLLCLLFLNGLFSPTAFSAVPGDIFDTDAEVRYTFQGRSFSRTDNAPFVLQSASDASGGVGTPAAIDAWIPSSGAGTDNTNLPASQCRAPNGNPVAAAPLTLANGNPFALPAVHGIHPSDTIRSGNPLIIRVIDLDQNLNAASADTVTVTLRTDDSGDEETLILTETSAASGEFTGVIQTASAPAGAANNNCVLSLADNSGFSVDYRDADDSEDQVALALFANPVSRIFNALTGEEINGATISLIDSRTGNPATVFGDDGVSQFPSTIVTGNTVSDASGTTYNFGDGGYRFPTVPDGDYRIDVQETVTTRFPSEVSDQVLQTLSGAPYILSGISRGDSFSVNNGVFRADVPLDPKSDRILLEKNSSRTEAGVGDFVPFTISVNNAESDADNIQVVDTLPVGLTFSEDSLTLNGDPYSQFTISEDGRVLTVSMPAMTASETAELKYVTLVGPQANGDIINRAEALHSVLRSNTASATIRIRDDFFRNTSRLFGRVIMDDCKGNLDADGLEGVRLYLEDGTYVVTDDNGEWHIEDLRPGTHVVQLDMESVPDYLEVVRCDDSYFHAGTDHSQFVDVQPGTFWRVDFHLRVKAPPRGEVVQTLKNELIPYPLSEQQQTGIQSPVTQKIQYSVTINGNGMPLNSVQELIALPTGVITEPGSLTIDGKEPENYDASGNSIVINLGDKPAEWSHDIRFNGIITQSAQKGTLKAKARLYYKVASRKSQSTQDAQTEALLHLPPADGNADPVSPPRFADFAEKLTEQDKQNLNDVVFKLEGLRDLKIVVRGHTDNIPIAAHNKHIYENNQELSEARASSVASYLSQRLNLKPEQIDVQGYGESRPVADNKSAEGRALNRRVEVRVLQAMADVEVASIEADTQIARTEGLIPGLDTASATAAGDTIIQAPEVAEKPLINEQWFALSPTDNRWVWPADHVLPSISATDIMIQHPQNTQVRLLLNGEEVHSVYADEATLSRTRNLQVSRWKGISIEEGNNHFTAEILDRNGNTIDTIERTVHLSGAPASAEWIPEFSHTFADGIRSPVIAVRLKDKDGYPIRPDSKGQLDISAPYELLQSTEYDQNPLVSNEKPVYRTEDDGIAFIELQPTARSGEVTLSFTHANGVTDDVRVWLQPAPRDWLLVGLGDLTIGQNSASSGASARSGGKIDENIYHDGRVAFFAKGQISGDLLLTAAYDSAKEETTPFATLIQPGEFYTLYGDASRQSHDAVSGEKLYVKVEKQNFYALFGDLNTGLDKTRLSRYVRTLTGVQVVYSDDLFDISAFGSQSDLGFVRDDIQGNGTSGLYQLSHELIAVNSETITLEVRDRLQPDIILSTENLTRNIDYSLDSRNGTLYFKSPVPATDNAFNPVYIVARYETEQPESGHTAGGRFGISVLDDQLKTGVTVVEENTDARDQLLTGVDAELEIGDLTIKAEVAQTSNNGEPVTPESNDTAQASRVEATYRGDNTQIRAYTQKIDESFGLGQQNAAETDQQRTGVETSFYLTDQDLLQLNAFHQRTLSTGNDREQADVEWTHKLSSISTLQAGLLSSKEDTSDGVAYADELSLGAGWQLFDQSLRLNSQVITDITERSEDNDRVRLGAEYRWSDNISSFAEYERSVSATALERTTIGLRTQPWQGAQAEQSLSHETVDDGFRLYSVSGLSQDWKLNDQWLVSFGFNQSRNLEKALPTETGTTTEDFNAFSVGWGYRTPSLQWTNRLEHRDGEISDTFLAHTALYHPLSESVAMGGSLDIYREDNAAGTYNRSLDTVFDLAIRPQQQPYALLLQTRWAQDVRSDGSGPADQNRRLINNAHLNWLLTDRDQLSTQYGIKYTLDQFDDEDYTGTTHYLGAEWRHQFTSPWDVGMHGRELLNQGGGQREYSYGISVGYTPVKNLWTSIGYNFDGFTDTDFSAAAYTSRGIYLKLRFKADQDTLSSLRQAFSW